MSPGEHHHVRSDLGQFHMPELAVKIAQNTDAHFSINRWLFFRASLRRRRTWLGSCERAPCVLPQRLGLLDHFFLPDTGDFFRDTGVSGSGAPAAERRRLDFLIDRSLPHRSFSRPEPECRRFPRVWSIARNE